jgi:3-deoxy-manno-octulosonate cytidylyltransferase (CMP-KDO synthetase)
MNYHIMSPARFASERLPGKLLLELQGKPILQHTYERCMQTSASSCMILCDDKRIRDAALKFGADVLMTSEHCMSGTDRIIEAVQTLNLPLDTVIVNVQGDEPLIDPKLIDQVANALINNRVAMATLAYPIENPDEINNPSVVKAIRREDGFAKTFTRKPLANEDGSYLRHIGIYAYTAKFLLKMVDLPPSPDQIAESLEQLKVLHHGEKIYIDIARVAPQQDINTEDDYQKLISITS